VDTAQINLHRRPRKIRRSGRHTTPSQAAVVAGKATKAAPAVAIAGSLVAMAPQAHAAETTSSAKITTSATVTPVAGQVRTDAVVARSAPATRTYTVHSGDSLSSIADHFYGNALTSSVSSLSGTLSCSGLEQLWESAGGSSAEAFMAAEIAEAESGGNQYALSPTDDYGYWQINASHGSLATFNALGNAKAAISISDDGTNWGPWTTYTTGAYEGRC